MKEIVTIKSGELIIGYPLFNLKQQNISVLNLES